MLDFAERHDFADLLRPARVPGPARAPVRAPVPGPARTRALRGREAHLAGRAAEDCVLRHYLARGDRLLARRWRGFSGEIDLVLGRGDTVVFIEVKRAPTHARAAEMLRPAQVRRILAASEEYVDRILGRPFIEREFHLALVDGIGRIEVVEDAFLIF